jgi:hypothetical protein
MVSILRSLYETCCAGWRPKEQKIINRILQDMEELAEEEVDRLLRHLALKKKTSSCCC